MKRPGRDRPSAIASNGEPSFVDELVDVFLAECEESLAELHGAVRDHDTDAVDRTLRRLERNAARVGARDMLDMCHRIEAASRAGPRACAAPMQELQQEIRRVALELELGREELSPGP